MVGAERWSIHGRLPGSCRAPSAGTLSARDRARKLELTIGGERVVLLPLDITAVPGAALGEVGGSLKDESDALTNALDLLFARY